jgi:hypothetical protein
MRPTTTALVVTRLRGGKSPSRPPRRLDRSQPGWTGEGFSLPHLVGRTLPGIRCTRLCSERIDTEGRLARDEVRRRLGR